MPPYKPTVEPRSYKRLMLLAIVVAVIIVAIFAANIYSGRQVRKLVTKDTVATKKSANIDTPTPQNSVSQVAGLILDKTKNYGNKYSSGLLPVGDNRYMTNSAKQGYVYECRANFVPSSQAGAQTRGPWFTNHNTQWDLNKKAHIAGSINWKSSMSVIIKDGKRVITTNDLPSHTTGVYPVAVSDPARVYDANPGTITAQTLSYSLTASPIASASPNCMGGEVGIMLTGSALFNAFDAGGRDAGAWEVQDSCSGHPQNKGEYHYHTMSSCITDTSVSTIIGYALDGYPITGPKVGNNNILTTSDLDECHGINSEITLDGKLVTSYHYVMTQDFPYSVSCFKATAVQPPAQKESTSTQSQNQAVSQQQPTNNQKPPAPPAQGPPQH